MDDVPGLGLEVRADATGASRPAPPAGGRRAAAGRPPRSREGRRRRRAGSRGASIRSAGCRLDSSGAPRPRERSQLTNRNSFALNSTRQSWSRPCRATNDRGEPGARDRSAAGRRPAARRARPAASDVVARVAADAPGELPGTLLHERVVRHGERLDRRDRPRPPRRHDRRVGAVERFEQRVVSRPRPEAVDRPAIDRLRELAGRVGELVIGVGALPVELDVLEARAADPSVERPGDRQRGVADGLALQPPRGWPARAGGCRRRARSARSLRTRDSCRYAAEVTIRRCMSLTFQPPSMNRDAR